MITCDSIKSLHDTLNKPKFSTSSIAFVPTMGNLHEGHLSLVRKARELADIVVVSIFVNPMQFGANEDLDKYPRTLEADHAKLEACDADILLFPTVNDIYPIGLEQQTRVSVPDLTQYHCGASRPGHFDGVTTIVNKLFNIVQPDIAVFGQKDFQQLAVIRKMVEDLCIPIEIIGCPTGRAEDGLALSSRNQYLNEEERAKAPTLYKVLQNSQIKLQVDIKMSQKVTLQAIKELEEAGFQIDYFNVCDARTLSQVTENTKEVAILAAAFLGKTRLIDNVSFPLNP